MKDDQLWVKVDVSIYFSSLNERGKGENPP